MTLLLAPMEGLLDATLRDALTLSPGVDRCVSEFIRVTGTLLPERVFLRIVPELAEGGRTPGGVPVRAQLMGSDPVCLADNAARLAGLGPAGIDLNFGCPAKVVNRHGGGAALLEDPALIGRIVEAVRRAVPAGMPVSAKMRLGVRDDRLAVDCAQAMAGGGAGELVVHARTRLDGYRPPAWWSRIAPVREAVAIPVIANGEIWTLEDALRARAESGCQGLMLGRGAVADPGLAAQIRAHDEGAPVAAPLAWTDLQPVLLRFWARVCARLEPRYRAGRLKQWLFLLRRRFPEAGEVYDRVRTVNDSREVSRLLWASYGLALPEAWSAWAAQGPHEDAEVPDLPPPPGGEAGLGPLHCAPVAPRAAPAAGGVS
jgi:tRNA-dihydrouridine synthase C